VFWNNTKTGTIPNSRRQRWIPRRRSCVVIDVVNPTVSSLSQLKSVTNKLTTVISDLIFAQYVKYYSLHVITTGDNSIQCIMSFVNYKLFPLTH